MQSQNMEVAKLIDKLRRHQPWKALELALSVPCPLSARMLTIRSFVAVPGPCRGKIVNMPKHSCSMYIRELWLTFMSLKKSAKWL